MPIGIFNGNSRHIQYGRELENLRRESRELFLLDYGDAIMELKALDPDGWESWYDERQEQTMGEMLAPIKARVQELEQKADPQTEGERALKE